MAKEELLIKLSLFEQQARQLEEQIQQIDSQIKEFEVFSSSIKNLGEQGSKGKEILAPIGKGIFGKVKLEEDKFFVNVGEGVFLKKNPEQAVEIINNQIDKLKKSRIELIEAVGKINLELDKIMLDAQK